MVVVLFIFVKEECFFFFDNSGFFNVFKGVNLFKVIFEKMS